MPVKKKARPVAVEAPMKAKPSLSKDQLLDFLRQMRRIRSLEERSAQAYGQGKIGGFCHLYIGQEAVAVGALGAARKGDYVLTTYRDHGMALMRGLTPVSIFGELFGRVCGCSRGRGGSMHMFDRELRFLGGHGIVGAHIALGTGAAFTAKYRGDDDAVLCFFGEGAVHNGGFHEALNLAALWALPIVFVCENNKYGMGTALERITKVSDLHKKAESYGMAHGLIDGMDVLAVHAETKRALAEARLGKPSFLEMRTYRFRGHSMSDPANYRSKEEVEGYRGQDPILVLGEYLKDHSLATEDELNTMEREVTQEMRAAMEEALQSPEPDPATVFDFVYQNPITPGAGN